MDVQHHCFCRLNRFLWPRTDAHNYIEDTLVYFKSQSLRLRILISKASQYYTTRTRSIVKTVRKEQKNMFIRLFLECFFFPKVELCLTSLQISRYSHLGRVFNFVAYIFSPLIVWVFKIHHI